MSSEGPQGGNKAFVRALIPASIFSAVLTLAGVFAYLRTDNWLVLLPCLAVAQIPTLYVVLVQMRRSREGRSDEDRPDDPGQPPLVQ